MIAGILVAAAGVTAVFLSGKIKEWEGKIP